MINLGFKYNQLAGILAEDDILLMQDEIDLSHSLLVEKAGKGNELLGWIDQPLHIDDEMFGSIEKDATLFRSGSELIIIIGIGGLYSGSRAIIDALRSPFSDFTYGYGNPAIVYAGHQLSQSYHAALIDLLNKKDYSIVAFLESDTTLEPGIAFRLLKDHLIKKYGLNAAKQRIIKVTGKSKSTEDALTQLNDFKTYYLPENIGSLFSAFTPAGLIPVSLAGFNIRELVNGAIEMRKTCVESSALIDNPASCYAAVRTSLYRMGFQIEMLVKYEPSLNALFEWWKQLFGGSEGKGNEGLFPTGADFTVDLYSIGQYLQDGQRILFETIINTYKQAPSIQIPFDEANTEGLNYLAGKTMLELNNSAILAAKLAHIDRGVPCVEINLPQISEQALGELMFFFQFACGMSGYLSGVNPFSHPGVNIYKNNLYALLEKPGYETETEEIRKRINEE